MHIVVPCFSIKDTCQYGMQESAGRVRWILFSGKRNSENEGKYSYFLVMYD